jgi:hypothetical protein
MPTRHDDGFTLTEVLLAMVLMVTAVMGAAALATTATRTALVARLSTSTLALTLQKVEQLTTITWAVDQSGTLLTDAWTDLSAEPHGESGTGLGSSPPDSLLANATGFVDFLDARGVWIGAGHSPPPGTAFVRRWHLEPLDGALDRAIVMRVFTTGVGQAQSRGAAGAAIAALPDAALVSIRTRTTR